MSAMKTYYKHFTELSRHIASAALGCISQRYRYTECIQHRVIEIIYRFRKF